MKTPGVTDSRATDPASRSPTNTTPVSDDRHRCPDAGGLQVVVVVLQDRPDEGGDRPGLDEHAPGGRVEPEGALLECQP